MVALAGALGWFAAWAWWLELFAHFRPQYALLLAACGVGLLLLGPRPAGLVALVLAAANALPLAHHLASPATGPAIPVAATGPSLKALLVNVWFRNDQHRRLLDYVELVRPDVAVFLEVTPAWQQALQALEGSLPYQARAGELLVASRRPLAGLRVLPLADGAAMAISFQVDLGGTPLTVVAAHANWPLGPAMAASRNRELGELAAILRQAPAPVLALGDFNVTAYSPAFTALLAESGLRDCSAGRGFNPTWPAYFPPLYLQIDHCLASPGLAVAGLGSGPYVGSDHFPLEVELRLDAAAAPEAVTAWRPTSRP